MLSQCIMHDHKHLFHFKLTYLLGNQKEEREPIWGHLDSPECGHWKIKMWPICVKKVPSLLRHPNCLIHHFFKFNDFKMQYFKILIQQWVILLNWGLRNVHGAVSVGDLIDHKGVKTITHISCAQIRLVGTCSTRNSCVCYMIK